MTDREIVREYFRENYNDEIKICCAELLDGYWGNRYGSGRICGRRATEICVHCGAPLCGNFNHKGMTIKELENDYKDYFEQHPNDICCKALIQ